MKNATDRRNKLARWPIIVIIGLLCSGCEDLRYALLGPHFVERECAPIKTAEEAWELSIAFFKQETYERWRIVQEVSGVADYDKYDEAKFRKDAIAGRNFWKSAGAQLRPSLFCSDAFKEAWCSQIG